MIKLPGEDKNFTSSGRSTVLGNFVSSFNMDLYSNKGKMRVSGRGLLNVNSDTEANLTIPVAFKQYSRGESDFETVVFYALSNRVYNTTANTADSTFVENVVSGAPTTADYRYSDMELFNGYLYVTTTEGTGKVYKFLGNVPTWSSFNTVANSGPAMLCAFNFRMYMSVGASCGIVSWNTSDSVATSGSTTFGFSNFQDAGQAQSYIITFMRVAQNRIFVGLLNRQGKGAVAIWDGQSDTTLDKFIKLDSAGPMSCVVKNDTPYIMDARGYLMRYNGSTFEELDRLPLFNQDRYLKGVTDGVNDRFIHPNGMCLSKGKVNLLITTLEQDNSTITSQTLEQYCPSGVWEYDEDIGLYHKGSASYATSASGTVTDFGQMRLKSVGAIFDAGTSKVSSTRDGNLLFGAEYYTTASASKYGIFYNEINQTKTGTFTFTNDFLSAFFAGSHSTDGGDNPGWTFTDSATQTEVSATLTSAWTWPTGVYKITFSDGQIRWGTFTESSTTVTWTNAIQGTATTTITVSPLNHKKWGYIITPEMYSSEIESTWNQVYARYGQFLSSSSKIYLKYRTVMDKPQEAAITWTSTSSFTTQLDLSLYSAGHEVEITQGTGSGKSAHIVTLSFSSSTGLYTVTLDDTFEGATGTALARFTKWTQLGESPISSTDTKQFKKLSLSVNSNDTKIQFKICALFVGNEEIEQLIAVEKPEVVTT